MESIQNYKAFIYEYKDKLKSSALSLIKIVEEEIIPKIKEILEFYDDETFVKYDVNLVDGDGNGVSSDCLHILRFEGIGNWNIHIGVEFTPNDNKIGSMKNYDMMKQICRRVETEFPDDLECYYCGGCELLFGIKV